MTFAVLAPEYFPGPLWAAIALSSDVVVLADTFPYVRQSLQNRARLRTPSGASWLTVPVARGGPGRPLASIRADDSTPWIRTHRRTLQYHYGSSAFGPHYLPVIEASVLGGDGTASGRLSDLTWASCSFLLGALGATARVARAGDLPGRPSRLVDVIEEFRPEGAPILTSVQRDRLPARIPGALVATWNPAPYRQAFDGWVDGCSALDLLLNHGPEAAAMLRRRLSLERAWRDPSSSGSEVPVPPGEIPLGHD